MQQIDNLTKQIFSLPEKHRAQIAHAIIESLEDYDDKSYDHEWNDKIERRVQEVISGKERGKSAE